MLNLTLDERGCKNPVMAFLREHYPVVAKIIGELGVTYLGVLHIGPTRLRTVFLTERGGEPLTFAQARAAGVSPAELNTKFDVQIENDLMQLVIDWQPMPFVVPSEALTS